MRRYVKTYAENEDNIRWPGERTRGCSLLKTGPYDIYGVMYARSITDRGAHLHKGNSPKNKDGLVCIL